MFARMGRPIRLGIRERLLVVVATSLAFFAIAIGVVFAVLSDVTATYDRLLDVDERILLDATRLRVLAERQVSLAEEIAAPTALDQLVVLGDQQNQVIDDIARLAVAPEDRGLLQRIRVTNDAYVAALRDAAQAFQAGRADRAVALFMQLDRPRDDFLRACDALIVAKTASRDAARAAASARFRETLIGLVLVLAVGGAGAAGIALVVGGRIARGVVDVAGSIRRIAAGELERPVDPLPDGELSQLAADVDELRRSLLTAREAEETHRQRVEMVRDLGRDLLAANDLGAALGLLAERTGRALRAIGVTATLIDARDQRLVREASYGSPGDRTADQAAPISSPDGAFQGDIRVWRDPKRSPSPAEPILLEAIAAEAGLALRNAALAEAAQRRADELDRFVHVVAHDVRGPVSMAQRLAELIRNRNPILAASEAPLFARIGDATAYAEGLIDDLRELVRIGRVPTRREPIALAEAVADAGQAVGAVLAEHGVALQREIGGDVWVRADRRQLRQVLTNLFENAAHHMGETAEPARVRVEASRTGDWWRVGVLDNGKGIPADARGQVFLPFRRLGREGEAQAGMGMGLAIARRIVEGHGGAIWIDEAPGGGCAVYFTLPTAEPAEVSAEMWTVAPEQGGVAIDPAAEVGLAQDAGQVPR
jgi:signal transduction histidine kinase